MSKSFFMLISLINEKIKHLVGQIRNFPIKAKENFAKTCNPDKNQCIIGECLKKKFAFLSYLPIEQIEKLNYFIN